MMAVREFEEYIRDNRFIFRDMLESSDGKIKEFIQYVFNDCTNQFEEDTLIENLKEEFEDYLKEFKN